MKWARVLFIVLMITLTAACAPRKQHAEDVTDNTAAAQADTATIEDNLPPVVQDQPQENQENAVATHDQNPPAPDTTAVPLSNPENIEAPLTAQMQSVSPEGTGVMDFYTVHKGDTLMKIAFNVYGDITKWRMIYDLNKDSLSSAGRLRVGQKIKYDKPMNPPVISQNGDPYLIKGGDTLGKIADDIYGHAKKWRKLYENNQQLIKDPNKIYVGFYLYYQITSEEKAEAERVKSTRSATPPTLGGSPTVQPDAAPTAVVAPAPALAPASETEQKALNVVPQPTNPQTNMRFKLNMPNRLPAAASK